MDDGALTPHILSAAIVAALISYLAGQVLRVLAVRFQWLDIPNERSSHSIPVPRMGGIAIFVGVAAGAAWLTSAGVSLQTPSQPYFVGPLIVIFAIGLIDDLRSLPAYFRLAIQMGCAAWLVLSVGSQSPIGGAFWIPVAIAWLVGLTNAYNFMDGIDGVAGAQAVVASIAWLVLGIVAEETWIVPVAVLVGAAASAFLLLNWQPARLFMGDAGSTGLGFAFGQFALAAWLHDPLLGIAGVAFVWPFVFDTLVTWLRRARDRENLFGPHRTHFYQRLTVAGWSHRKVTCLYGAAAAIGSAAAIAGFVVRDQTAAAIVIATLAAVLWRIVLDAEHRVGKRQAGVPRPQGL